MVKKKQINCNSGENIVPENIITLNSGIKFDLNLAKNHNLNILEQNFTQQELLIFRYGYNLSKSKESNVWMIYLVMFSLINLSLCLVLSYTAINIFSLIGIY